ncbi:type II toxin-antitoxin system PemK/MazF family toxin [Hominifimenecus sp. rT4P-3]|uniref:type II toxin-antitoxin system PemK/MazF family toxin n=1 Tax=Hominifimenecus sp. rT4P-3 TaxID=3242979 RepID=UPI003DA663A4
MEIKRGDIYYADLNPTVGCEQGGVRPVLIIQNNVGNHFSPTVIAAAITSRRKKDMPTHVLLDEEGTRLFADSRIMLEQVRTIDRERLKEYIGSANAATMQYVDHAIAVSFGLDELLAQQEETEK